MQSFSIKHKQRKIDYFKIDSDSFLWGKEIELKANQGGYITKDFIDKIRYKESDTCIVNVGVGHGKTQTIYKVVSDYARKDDYVIIVLSPFEKLVQKDYDNLTKLEKPASKIN